MNDRKSRRGGFSMVEMLLVLSLTAVGVTKLSLVLRAASRAQANESTVIDLESQAQRVLDQIAYAVMSSDRETLIPDPESPWFSAELRFRASLGVEDGEVVWGEPEMVQLSDERRQVVYRQNYDAEDELRVVWCNIVRPYLDGELANDEDDNDNGLVDELGLSFSLVGDSVEIRLSLEKTGIDGKTVKHFVETTVTCRN